MKNISIFADNYRLCLRVTNILSQFWSKGA